jgi:hypothetical protein
MSVRSWRSICALALLAAGGAALVAQSLPTSQPKLLTITRERIKTGHDAAHLTTEAGWPAAYAQAKSPDYYLALVSMTGSAEVWFVSPRDSYTAWGKSMESEEANPQLTADLARLWAADGEHLDGSDQIEATAVPALSIGTYPDLSHTRFWRITLMRVRPGHEQRFVETATVYKAIAGRVAPNLASRVYAVSAGMPGPTYIILSSVQSFGQFDAMAADGSAISKGATPQELAVLQKFLTDDLVSSTTNRYRLDPAMSYVSDETKKTDPAFWNKK